jgi:hypothetical protein
MLAGSSKVLISFNLISGMDRTTGRAAKQQRLHVPGLRRPRAIRGLRGQSDLFGRPARAGAHLPLRQLALDKRNRLASPTMGPGLAGARKFR